jgi:hypothetical protein
MVGQAGQNYNPLGQWIIIGIVFPATTITIMQGNRLLQELVSLEQNEGFGILGTKPPLGKKHAQPGILISSGFVFIGAMVWQ